MVQMLTVVLCLYGLPNCMVNQERTSCGQLKNVLIWLFWFLFCGDYLQCYIIKNEVDR